MKLFPKGFGDAELPESIIAYRCPVGLPNGAVLADGFERVVGDYEVLVPDLLCVHYLFQARA